MAQNAGKAHRSAFRTYAENSASEFGRTALNIPDGVSMLKIKAAGRKELDILGYIAGEGNPNAKAGEIWPERTFYVHNNIGAREATYVCPAQTAGKKCPVCEYHAKLKRKAGSDKDLMKEADAFKAKKRQLWWVRDLSDPDKGWQVWEFSWHNFGNKLIEEIKNLKEDEDFDMFYTPGNGYTLRVNFKEESGGSYKYYEAGSIRFEERAKAYTEKTVNKLACLDDMLIILSYKQLKSIFFQMDPDEDVDNDDTVDEEDDTPPPKAKAKTKAPVDDDDDDDDAPAPAKKKAKPPVDDDDEDDAPPPKKKKAAPPADEDDEDEDDDPPPKKTKAKAKPPADDDDEDDDPPPKAKATKAKAKPPVDDDDEDDTPPPKKKKAVAEEDDDDDAPPPKKKAKPPVDDDDDDEPAPKKKTKAKAPVDDDGDDWDNFDEDEEPAPKSKKKG